MAMKKMVVKKNKNKVIAFKLKQTPIKRMEIIMKVN